MGESSDSREIEGEQEERALPSEEMFSRVYAELKQMARTRLSREYNAHSLNATVLVHDAYLRLAKDDQRWKNRRYFFAAASESMRRILIERARARKRIKRGGDLRRQDLRESQIIAPAPDDELLAIDEALEKLATADPDAAELVKLRFFVGMTQEEIAELHEVSVRTVKRQWAYARAWLKTEMSERSVE